MKAESRYKPTFPLGKQRIFKSAYNLRLAAAHLRWEAARGRPDAVGLRAAARSHTPPRAAPAGRVFRRRYVLVSVWYGGGGGGVCWCICCGDRQLGSV